MAKQPIVKCQICGTHGHPDRKCPVYKLNRQQEASQADRDRLVALGLNPELEAQIDRIRASWKQEHKTNPTMPEIGPPQVSAGFAARAAQMLSTKFKRCAYLVLFCFLLPHLHAGTITGQIQTPTGGVINNGTLGFSLSQPAVLSGTAMLSSAQSYCYTSTVGNIVGLPDPLSLPVLSTNTGSGTLPAATYYVKLTYYGAGGETVASPEANAVLSAQGTLIINAPVLQPASATGYKIYISSSTGTETLQATITGFTQYQQSTPLSAGSALPSSNSTVCSLVFSDQLIPTGTYYTVSFVNKNGAEISGFPMTWCTFGGSSGTINVSNGAPTGNCGTNGVFYPTPLFANPANNAAQSESGAFTFQSNVTFNGPVVFNSSASFSQGIVAPFFQSSSINPAATGLVRLESGDQICWRNNANSADVCISKTSSDNLSYPNGLSLGGGAVLGSTAQSGTGSLCMTTNCQLVTPALNAVVISGTPSASQVLTATSPTAASWANPSASFFPPQVVNLASPVALTGSPSPIQATVLSKTVTFPATPGTYRAVLSYTMYITVGANLCVAEAIDYTNGVAYAASGQDANGTGYVGLAGSEITTATYAANASVTFHLDAMCNNAAGGLVGATVNMNAGNILTMSPAEVTHLSITPVLTN